MEQREISGKPSPQSHKNRPNEKFSTFIKRWRSLISVELRAAFILLIFPSFSLTLSFGSSCESEACRNSRWASEEGEGLAFDQAFAVAGFSPRRGFKTQELFITVDQAHRTAAGTFFGTCGWLLKCLTICGVSGSCCSQLENQFSPV